MEYVKHYGVRANRSGALATRFGASHQPGVVTASPC